MPTDTRVGPYRILRLINRGGQGSVYLGYDKRLHRRVAIKVCSLPRQRAARRQLLREAQLVASIQSPKVVQIHDVIESSGHLALVMEYVPGCDLDEFLALHRPSLASTLIVGADLAGALAAARQQRIVHGDLKAKNVLITASGRVKLTDFGIARSAAAHNSQQGLGASLCALSPEQYLGKPLDVRSDLFALGCLLYRMLSGEQPFFRGGRLDSGLLLQGSPRPLREIVADESLLPDELARLVADLLQVDPQNRPDNTHRVRQVMRKLSGDIPLAAKSSLLQQARPCFRRESADDIPPLIPADLGRDARSRLPPGGSGAARFGHRLGLLGWPARAAIGCTLCVLLLGASFIVLRDTQTSVHIEAPVLRVAPDLDLPAELSARWLVEEVKLALAERLGAIAVSGPVGATQATTLYIGTADEGRARQPEEQLRIDLRCAAGFCVLALAREHEGQRSNQQSVLYPDMTVGQWRDIIRSTTLALYR